MVARITISIPDELADELDSRLSYGDSRSAWIQQAIEERIAREEAEEGNPRRAMASMAD